jgi:hypothetical protein
VPLLLREKMSWGRLSVEADLGPIPVVNKERWRHLFSDGIRAAALKKAGGGEEAEAKWMGVRVMADAVSCVNDTALGWSSGKFSNKFDKDDSCNRNSTPCRLHYIPRQ